MWDTASNFTTSRPRLSYLYCECSLIGKLTQICCFHLRNRDAKRKLDVTWNGLEFDHYPNPIYFGVTLDRTLSFKQHALNTKAKVNTRNNLLRKLTDGDNSRWGAHPATVRTTALAHCFSTAEYACSSWGRSRHTGHVDIALNDTCRIITGCLKATPRLPPTQIAASKKMTRDTHSMANALPSTGLHPETAFLTQQKHLTPQNKMLVPHCG